MANIKSVFRYIDDISRAKFCNSQCLLTISVGQEVHENEKFETTIDLIHHSFDSCIMLIDDSLQRHTMVLDRKENADELYAFSIEEGDRWLIRNEQYYNRLTNLKEIIRWDKWLKHPDYIAQQQTIKTVINNDIQYKSIFNETITEFLTRYFARIINKNDFDKERAYSLCFDYLLEECTAMTLWPELKCQFEVYPSKRNFAMDETHKRFVLPHYPDLLHAVAIKFKNRKQLKPQQFNLVDSLNKECIMT